ncbi:hypothetical protein SO802_008373 [Lithocarpus litseifolius]|uniref:CCHC-type domain-containing protein n=1 Tax=Lithocarpus litseifolius TaxID=425828 RepID=A0AAW2DCJ9_9ROSI
MRDALDLLDLGKALGTVPRRLILPVLGKALGAEPRRLRCPTSKRASPTFNLISCEAKEVVYHRIPVFEYRNTMLIRLKVGEALFDVGHLSLLGSAPRALPRTGKMSLLGTVPRALPRSDKNSPHNKKKMRDALVLLDTAPRALPRTGKNLGKALGTVPRRLILPVLGKALGAEPRRLRCPTSKRASPTFNLISCEAKEVVYHRIPVFEYRNTMLIRLKVGEALFDVGHLSLLGSAPRALPRTGKMSLLGTVPRALPRSDKTSAHRNDLRIVDVGEGLFQFRFKLESQLTWVLNSGPWSFDNTVLVLRRWERDQARFIRIRVELPLEKPIRRGGWVANPEGDQVRVGFKYERLVGLCYQCGRFGHEMKECSSQRSTQPTERPYGEWLKAGVRRKESASDRVTYSPPMQQTAPESAAQARGQTVTHVMNADVNGIKTINDTWSLQTNPHESPNNYGQPEIMGMEINVSGVIASDTLDPSLINVPVKYDEQKARDPLPTHLNQPRERLPSMGKKHKPRISGNKISGSKIIRHTTTQTHTNPKGTTSRNLKRNQPEDHLPLEEELKQHEKRSKAAECNPKIIKTVEAAARGRGRRS